MATAKGKDFHPIRVCQFSAKICTRTNIPFYNIFFIVSKRGFNYELTPSYTFPKIYPDENSWVYSSLLHFAILGLRPFSQNPCSPQVMLFMGEKQGLFFRVAVSVNVFSVGLQVVYILTEHEPLGKVILDGFLPSDV